MLSILGPAKTIDMTPHGVTETYSSPEYLEQAYQLGVQSISA